MGEGSWSPMDQAPADMKLTMDLKDHSPIELTWAIGQFQWTSTKGYEIDDGFEGS
jgi:hypothetical protein